MPLVSRYCLVLLFALAAVGPACGNGESAAKPAPEQGTDAGPLEASGPAFEASLPEGVCGAIVEEHPIEGRTHVAECSYVHYDTLPPSSGNHYPVWAAYKTYTLPVPEGYWVHNLEHGTVVLSYNCEDAGCAEDVAAAQTFMDGYPADPVCTSLEAGVEHRLLMTPDPHLDVRFAASAWGWTLRANCFDPVAFQAFADAHYGQGPEDLCGDGEDVVGATGAPASCGAPP